MSDKNGRTSLFTVAALGTLVGREDALPQPDALRGDFDELVFVDELDGLLQPQNSRGNQANRFVSGGRAHVGLLLFPGDIDVHVTWTRILANDHAFVDDRPRIDED